MKMMINFQRTLERLSLSNFKSIHSLISIRDDDDDVDRDYTVTMNDFTDTITSIGTSNSNSSSTSISTKKKSKNIKSVKFADTDTNDDDIKFTDTINVNINTDDEKKSTTLLIRFPDGCDKTIDVLITDTVKGFDLMLLVRDMKYTFIDTDKILVYLNRKRSYMDTISNGGTFSNNSNIPKSKMVTKDERIVISKDSLLKTYSLRNNDIIEVVMNTDANINNINGNDRLRALNYMEFVRSVVPEDLSRNVSIHTDIIIKFGPNSSGLTLFTPALLDKEAMRSFLPISPDKFKDEDFKYPHFIVKEKVQDKSKEEQIDPASLICESCRFKHTKVFITCEVCGSKNKYGSFSPKNRSPVKPLKTEDDENKKLAAQQLRIEQENMKEKSLLPLTRPGDMCLHLGSVANAKARGFKQWTTKKFQSRIHLLELTENIRNVDLLIERMESARYSFNGINDGYTYGDDDSWQRYTSLEPIECRITLSDEYDIFSSLADDESIITLKPYEPLKYNQTYIIYVGNSIPIVPNSLDSLFPSYSASHVCEDKLFLFTTSYE